jgi:hypothetical protein
MTNLARRQGRIFPEIQWTIDRVAAREAFYQRCYPIFDRVRSELISTHHVIGMNIRFRADGGKWMFRSPHLLLLH